MQHIFLRRRFWTWVVTLGLVWGQPTTSPVLSVLGSALVPAVGVATLLAPTQAEAKSSSSRSSGGYSRPSSGSSRSSGGYRAPSTRSSPSPSRTPSTSGGYSRPSSGGSSSTSSPSYGSRSSGDVSQSRRISSDALQAYRLDQDKMRREADRFARPAEPAPAPTGRWNQVPRYSTYDDWSSSRTTWYGQQRWSPPPTVYQSRPSFGIWDGLMLWFLLDNLTKPGYSDFFHHHETEPGYKQWRDEANRLAANDPAMQAKLAALDQDLAAKKDRSRDPNYLPPDLPPGIALAANQAVAPAPVSSSGGFPSGLVILLVLGGTLLVLWRWRRRNPVGSKPGAGSGIGLGAHLGGGRPPPTSLSTRSSPEMDSLKTAAGMLRQKLGGEAYKPSLFRVGMTLTMDPTPFILAAGVTKVPVPESGGDSLLLSVEAVGRLGDGASALHRLYLPGGRGFFQLHLDSSGHPDECRYFGLLDQVQPADQPEWGFWLDPTDGMIGWPQFQTKDGKLYDRAWNPGERRIPPRGLTEQYQDVSGQRNRRIEMMLYAGPTGASPPAPGSEYILVASVESGDEAWVEVHAGIDVNPSALSLA